MSGYRLSQATAGAENASKYTLSSSVASNYGSIVASQAQKEAEDTAEVSSGSQNNGGFLGGIGYLGEKTAVGFMSSIEGIWDYAAGGLAKLFGADDWAEQQFANDWFGDWYSHPEEWYDPSSGWQVAGDVAGGIGTSLPGIAATVTGAAIAYLSGGTLSPVAAKLIGAGVAGLGAAGTSTKQAYRETGKLTGEEFGYGALSGVTEGSLEYVSSALEAGTGRIAQSISRSFAKETTETVAKQTVVKTLAKDFLGEAFEEGVSEILDPVWQRMTYDKDAENASLQEVAYAAFIGGMSGIVMSGGNAAINSSTSFLKGNSLVGKGLDTEVIGLSRQLSEFEKTNVTGDETFQSIAQNYADLSQSLTKTDGKVKTVTQKKLLGDLHRANTVAVFKPMIAKSAANIVANAETIAQRLNEYGYKTADGKPITFTAEQIRKGVDTGARDAFAKALKNNNVLRTLAVADTTGHLIMDTARFKQATLMGKKLASQVDLNRFIETATQSEIDAVSQALNINDWATLDADAFNRKITDFIESGGVQLNADRRAMVQAIKSIPAETVRPMPKMVNLRQDGTVRYSDGSTRIAITKQGDAYTIYDYVSDRLSKNMTRSEVNKLLRDYNIRQADILADTRAHMEAETELRRQAREIDAYARENISDYAKLSDPNQSMIRKIIREGRAKGMADEDILTYAKISAHAGIDIIFDKQSTFIGYDEDGNEKYADGFYDPKNDRIIVDPEAERSHERLLLHELEHIILKGKDGKKLIATAFESMDENTRSKILKKYSDFYRVADIGVAKKIDILNDEVSAHFAEDALSNRYILEKLIETEPSIKEKILSFFKGASHDYESVPKLSKAAKRYYKTYKKLFDAFAERNFQSNATETMLDVAETKETPVTSAETDPMRVTGDDAPELTKQDDMTKKAVKNIADKNAYRYAVDADLLEFVDSVSKMESKNAISKRKHTLGKISESHAKIVEDILSSELGLTIDAGEYTVNIDGSAVKHIEERHGVNGSSDHSMQNKADIARIGWVVNNAETGYIARIQTGEIDYSTQYRNADGSPSPKIMLEKYIGDGKFIVAECVPDTTSKKIHIISARKTKSGNGQVLNVKSNNFPQPTPKTLLDGITTTDSITDSVENVNSNSENSSKKNPDKRLMLKSDDGRSSEVKNADADTGRRYAIKYPNFSEADISSNMDAIADMKAVAAIDASKLEKTGRSPTDTFNEYFSSLGNNIASETFGDIALPKSSVKSEIRHGITAEKIASIEAIPAVIEQGKVIFHKTKDGGVERIVICAPIKIGEADYYMGVMLQRDARHQRLYLHNVASLAIEREATSFSKDSLVTTGALENENRLSITSILQKALNVKADKRKSTEISSGKRFALDADDPPHITSGMSDNERYEILKDKDIAISAETDRTKLESVMSKLDITESDLDLSKYGDKKRLFKKLGEEFGVFGQYNNPDTKVTFSLSKGGMSESVSKQRKGYMRLAKLLTCIDSVIENAVGIEAHNRNGEGYKADTSLKNVYVLASAFVDGDNIIPVKLEVKEFSDKENTLYVAIALESIKKNEIVKQEVATNGVARQYSPSFTISIADLLRKINPSNESFYKYIPKRLLEASKTEQYISHPSDAKTPNRTPDSELSLNTAPADERAFAEELSVPTATAFDKVKNTDNATPTISKDIRFALPKTDSNGSVLSEKQREYFSNTKVIDEQGRLLTVYHGSPAVFTEFSHRFMNTNGNAHGRGFYFTEDMNYADGYRKDGGQLLKGYLDIKKPASETKITMRKAELVKLIKATCEAQAKELIAEEAYGNMHDALLDTWVSNYANTYSAYSMDSVYKQVAEIIFNNCDNDIDIFAELTNAGAGTERVLSLARKVLGYDGVIYDNGDGTHQFVAFESNQFKNANNTDPTVNKDIRFALPIGDETVDTRSVTEQDVRDLLDNALKKQYRDGSYIPVRVNTPYILIEAAQSIGKRVDDLPIILNVGKARQMMSSQREWVLEQKRGTAHDLTVDDVISLIKAMDDPKQIIYQSADERYVEVVEFETAKKTKAIAVLEIGENKNTEYLNGYNGGFYQVLVTAFEPDAGYVESLLDKDGNVRIYPKKKKGSSQRGSGNKVPSHLNESPFANSIAETETKVKNFDETSLNGKRFALDTDTASEYSYDALTKKDDLTVVELPAEIPQTDDGKVDKKAILARGKLNARKQKNPNNTDTDTYVHVDDIGQDVLLGTKGLQHGLVRSEETALALMKIGDILRESVAVNEMNGNASRKTDMSYVLLGTCKDSENLYVVRSVVSKLRNDVTEIDVYQLSAVKGKKTEIPNSALKRGAAVTEQSSLISSGSPVMSIADLIEYVKTIPLANEIFSEDVAKKLGIERSKGTLSGDVRYALSDTDTASEYSYDALTKKDDLTVVELPAEIPQTDDGKIDRKAVVALGRLNARKQNNPMNTSDTVFVYVPDIGTDIMIRREGLEHGLTRGDDNTALATMRIGDLLEHSIAVNELNGRTKGTRTSEMSYVLLSVGQSKKSPYLVRIVADKITNSVTDIDTYGLYAVKAKKDGAIFMPEGNEAFSGESRLSPYLRSNISISDFLEKVKTLPLANEIFSEDVAKKLGIERSKGSLSGDVRYALSDTRGSIMTEVDPEYKPSVQDKVFSGWTAAQIAFTNAQAGIEAVGKKYGVRNIEALVQAARSGRNQAEEMITGNQYRIGADTKTYQGEGLEQIFRPIACQGKEVKGDFFDYLFNYHNMSRMTLEQRSMAEQQTRLGNIETKITALEKLNKRIEKLQKQIKTLGRSEKDMETRRGLREELAKAKAEAKALKKEATELEKVAKAFVPLENKAVFGMTDENGIETVVTAEQSEAIVRKYEEVHPEFKRVAEKVWAFLQNLNRYRVDTGLISQDTFDYLAKLYPHYVPTYRTGTTKGIGAIEGKYNLKVKTTIKTAKGSTKELLPPDVMIARQVMETVRAGRVNQLANALYEGAEKSGDTTYLEIVSRERMTNEAVAELDPTELRPKNNEVVFFRNGERITMRVSKEVFAGFNAFNPPVEIHNPLVNGARAINNGFKRLVTSLNPAFLVRNTIRDIQDAGINTKYGKTFIKNYARATYEISHNGKLWQLYKAMGGFSGSLFDFDKGFSGMQNKWGLTKAEGNLLKRSLQGVENANAFVEQLPRLAEFISSIEAGNSAEQAILDSADVTTNFGRMGNITKVLNSTLIPFLDPSIQGCSKMIRNITSIRSAREFGTLALKAALVGVAPMILNMLMYEDDEDYRNLRDNDKENNFLFKVGDTFVKIPRGRVASVIGGLINRGKSAAKGEDVDWAGYVENIMQQVTPVDSMSRTIFSPFSDVANNLTWYGTAIEGRQFENTAPKDRYDESTSSIAIAIGQAINYSPKKIHYLLDQYSGVIGDFILPATTAKAEKGFLSGNFTLDPATSNKFSTEFYEIYDQMQYAKTAGDDTAAYQIRYLNKVKSAISDMYKQKSEIQNAPDLSNAEKLQQSRVVQILINEAYKTALKDFELYTKAIEATAGMEDENLRSTEATRLMYGAERALSEYNEDVYAKCRILNKAGVDYETLYSCYFTVRGITSDTDKRGNVISGSKRKKIVAAINSLGVSVEQKLLLICSKGYSLQDNDIRGISAAKAKKYLLRYILGLKGVTQEEKIELAEMCGFEVKNGRVVTRSVFSTG